MASVGKELLNLSQLTDEERAKINQVLDEDSKVKAQERIRLE